MKPLLHYANKIFSIIKMSKTTNAVNQIWFDKKNDINPNPHGLLNVLFPTGGGGFCPRFGNHGKWITILTKLFLIQVSDEKKVC